MDLNDDGALQHQDPQSDNAPLSVTLYLQPPNYERIKLLEIPYDLIHLYSTKPRKWLRYCGYSICGCDGDLCILNADNEPEHGMPIDGGELDLDVHADERFVYYPETAPDFVDVALRERTHSASSSTSRNIPSNLRNYYGKCPFTYVTLASCQACHLIPRAKGEDYLRKVLQSRGDPRPEITIDDTENLLVMDVRMHNMFDHSNNVAFMQTPNSSLKTTDILRTDNPPAVNIGPDTSLVTVHCFDGDPEKREEAAHGKSSRLNRGCGYRSESVDESLRPNKTILHLIYGSVLLRRWATKELQNQIRKDSERRFYPCGKVRIGGDPGLKTEEERRWRRRAEQVPEREERLRRLNETREDADSFDVFDALLYLSYRARGTTEQEVEKRVAEAERRYQEIVNRYVTTWCHGVDREAPTIELDESGSTITPEDSEKPVSIEEAFNRTPPMLPAPSDTSTPSFLLLQDSSGETVSFAFSHDEADDDANEDTAQIKGPCRASVFTRKHETQVHHDEECIRPYPAYAERP